MSVESLFTRLIGKKSLRLTVQLSQPKNQNQTAL